MVLLVLTTLMISIIAIFGQIVVAQTTRMYDAENPLMETMVNWHGAAVDLVHSAGANFTDFVATGCRLTYSVTVTPSPPYPWFPLCTDTGGNSFYISTGALPVSGIQSPLPSGYNTANYSFYSIAFSSQSVDYIMTFVDPAQADANNYLVVPDLSRLANGSTGFKMQDLVGQFQRAAPSDVAYGVVSAGPVNAAYNLFTEVSQAQVNGDDMIYEVPLSVPVGAIGILSVGN